MLSWRGDGMENKGILNGNHLKLIAAFSMLLDHAGILLFPQIRMLRIIGRLAYPIFAFMIAEGCRYTKNKAKRTPLLCEFSCKKVLTKGG